MSRSKENIFAQAAGQREKEQGKIEAACNGESPKVGKPAKGVQRKSTTILLDPNKKIAIKKYAADHETNISDLFNEWIAEKCGEYLQND